MTDLMVSGGLPPTSNGSAHMTAPRRPNPAPMPTSSPSGIRGPRMIMQERAAREARQRAEAEQQALDKARATKEAQLLEKAQQLNAERQAAGIVTPGQGGTADTQPPVEARQYTERVAGTSQQARAPAAARTQAPPQQQQQIPQHDNSHLTSNQQSPPRGYQASSTQQPAHMSGRTSEGQGQTLDTSKPRNSFPHAFERWETLSAHWEGLTSYWIRKLEQNKDAIAREPLDQQLARQVTDLSAAGANLFHAVVELQRLRASSERKFQRWFFETRAELERSHEVNAMLEAALEKERRDRDQAIREAVEHERGVSKTQKQLVEMRKELSISKEEARRAWEELGRREQEERDRTFSLQSGHPTIVGGVQVVPMTQSGPSRHNSTRDPNYQSDYRPNYSIDQQAQAQAQAQAAQTRPQASPPSAGGSSAQYRQHDQTQHGSNSRAPAGGSEGGYSEGEYLLDEHDNYVRDGNGNRIPIDAPPSTFAGSDVDAEDYDTPATTNPPSGGLEQQAPAPGAQNPYANPQDYSGQGYDAAGWEPMPRHHHPTRLSDVIEEEDERSRTSGSQRRG